MNSIVFCTFELYSDVRCQNFSAARASTFGQTSALGITAGCSGDLNWLSLNLNLSTGLVFSPRKDKSNEWSAPLDLPAKSMVN